MERPSPTIEAGTLEDDLLEPSVDSVDQLAQSDIAYSGPNLSIASTAGAPDEGEDVSPERIAHLANLLATKMTQTVKEIDHVNSTTRLLALNAKIEAARVGSVGAAFSVVAGQISALSDRTLQSTSRLIGETQTTIGELVTISKNLATNVRGMRLSDLALNNIDLIDRNLYERSCDVRWWATDSSAVDALTEKSNDSLRNASKRLGVILSAYTVYFDLVLCDLNGTVVANGRPDQYRSTGMNCRDNDWFKTAMASKTGDEYGFQSVHESPLVNGKRILAYSCCVRAGGESNGDPIGVLGILFNWDGLAQTIVESTPLSHEEKERTRVCIIDDSCLVLADTANKQLRDRLPDAQRFIQASAKKTYAMQADGTNILCVAYAHAPGFETYSTGWHSLLIQEMEQVGQAISATLKTTPGKLAA